MSKVDEIPLPQNLRGQEVLRLVQKPDGGLVVAVNVTAFSPPEWGIALHDIAKRVALGLVENGIERSDGETVTVEMVLADICETLVAEQTSPTDETKDYEDLEKN